MQLSVQAASEFADGSRCLKCQHRKFRGLCKCERDARAGRNIAALQEWQEKVGKVDGIDIPATVSAAINREMLRAGWNSQPIMAGNTDQDPNAVLTAAQAVRIQRRNTKRQPGKGKRDPFRWQPYRQQVADEFPIAP